jgi:hypothetical protein
MAQRPPDIPSEPIERRSRGSSYFALWATLACFSALYLAAASIRPAFLKSILPASNSELAAQQATDIAGIRDELGQLHVDVTKMQSGLTEQSEQTRSLSDRIAALEGHRPADASAAAASPEEPQQSSAATNAGAEFPETGEPSDGPKVINTPLETGSVRPDADAAPAAPKKPAAEKAAAPAKPKKPVGIRLATGGSVDNLRVSWGVLAERHRDELKSLQPRYFNSVDGNGITYELVAGPFKSTAEAKKVCQSLKAQAIDCQVSNYGGNAL